MPRDLHQDILLDVHQGHVGFVADYGALTPRHKTKLESVRNTFHVPDEGVTASLVKLPTLQSVDQKVIEINEDADNKEGGHKELTVAQKYPKFGDMYTEMLPSSKDPNVLTEDFIVHKISYGYGYSQDFKQCIPPVLFKKEVWQEPLPNNMKEILKALVYQDNGELRLDDEEIKAT